MRNSKIFYSLVIACLFALSSAAQAMVLDFGNLSAASKGNLVTNHSFANSTLAVSMIFDSTPDSTYQQTNALLGNSRGAFISANNTYRGRFSIIDFSRKFDRNSRSRHFDDDRVKPKPITSPVPEPETYAMILAGLALIGYTARRRKQNY